MTFICTTLENALAAATSDVQNWNTQNFSDFAELGSQHNIWLSRGWLYRLIHRRVHLDFLAMSTEKAALTAAEQAASKALELCKKYGINADGAIPDTGTGNDTGGGLNNSSSDGGSDGDNGPSGGSDGSDQGSLNSDQDSPSELADDIGSDDSDGSDDGNSAGSSGGGGSDDDNGPTGDDRPYV